MRRGRVPSDFLPPIENVPIEALRSNIRFYEEALANLRQQERSQELSQFTTAVRGFRQRQIDNPIVRRRGEFTDINYKIVSKYYTIPRRVGLFQYANNIVIQNSRLSGGDTQTQLIFSGFPINAPIDLHMGETTLKSNFMDTGASALQSIIRKKQEAEDRYDEELEVRTIIIRFLVPTNILVIGQGGCRSEKTANQTWLLVDRKANTNCFYNCVAVFRICKRKGNENIEEYRERIGKFVNDSEFRKLFGNVHSP